MCWKTSSPDPEPSPAPMLLPTLSTVTEAGQFNVTEVSVSKCPRSAFLCDSTGLTCYNNGTVCCDLYNTEERFCSCQAGFEPPDCLIQDFEAAIGFSTYGENFGGRIGIIVFFLAVILLTIAVAVVLLLRRRRTRRQQQNSSTTEQGTELPDRHVDRKTSDSCSASLLNSHYPLKAEG